ncbi:hypothetical protein Drorol1_Dr00025919 [Drosera rotundifolia]
MRMVDSSCSWGFQRRGKPMEVGDGRIWIEVERSQGSRYYHGGLVQVECDAVRGETRGMMVSGIRVVGYGLGRVFGVGACRIPVNRSSHGESLRFLVRVCAVEECLLQVFDVFRVLVVRVFAAGFSVFGELVVWVFAAGFDVFGELVCGFVL